MRGRGLGYGGLVLGVDLIQGMVDCLCAKCEG